MKRLLLGLLFFVFTAPAFATNCYTQGYGYAAQNYSYGHSYAATYYTPVYYPVYSIGYQPPANESLKEELLKLKVELRDQTIELLKFKLQAGPGAVQAEPQQQASPLLAILAKNCASCHSDQTASAKGGGFIVLKDGKIDHLSPADKLNIIGRVITENPAKRMPKGGKLPDQEQVTIVQSFSGN